MILQPLPPVVEQPLKILMVTPEAVPYAKTGGLADVAGALPGELARLGHQVGLVIPRYGPAAGHADGFEGFQEWGRLSVPTATGSVPTVIERGVLRGPQLDGAVQVYAIRYDPFFDRKGLYQESGADYPDNLDRFAFFCRAVMELVPALGEAGWVPELLHADDWQTSLCAAYLRSVYENQALLHSMRTVLTIHNLGY